FVDWRAVKARIDAMPGVVASTPYAVSEVVIVGSGTGMNVIIKGIDPATVGKVTDLVSDLEDRDAIKRLSPLIDDARDLRAPPHRLGARPAPSALAVAGRSDRLLQPGVAIRVRIGGSAGRRRQRVRIRGGRRAGRGRRVRRRRRAGDRRGPSAAAAAARAVRR